MGVRMHNGKAAWGKTYRAMGEALIDCGEQFTKQGRTMMASAAEKWLRDTDAEWPGHTEVTRIGWGKNNVKTRRFGGDKAHPWYSGNLHDSVAVRISERNRTVAVRYMSDFSSKHATKNQTWNHQSINGAEWGRIAAQRSSHVLLPGTVAELVVGVPYTDKVNEESHPGFFEDLQAMMISSLEDAFYAGGNQNFRNLIVRPRK